MKTYLSVRGSGIMLTLFLLVFTFLFFSCNKIDFVDIEGNPSNARQSRGVKIISSVSGFVTNETDEAVTGATVYVGSSTCTTDDYGYFEVNEAEVSPNATVVTVSKSGFFNGIKTYNAVSNQSAFFRIKLIPKTKSGEVNGINGGKVVLANGLSISFPSDGIMDPATGMAYKGRVAVAAFWINPTAGDLNKIMPGDQRGVGLDGMVTGLTSYGMAAVELTGSSGQLLQIAGGKNATITMPIPSTILSRAPASIPLWYFNERTGIWEEQGHAVKKGNTYTGEVSHFSFWNCDTPGSFVEFNCTAVDMNGNPVRNALVKISDVNDPAVAGWGYTNAQGFASGIVPGNRQLRLEIMGDAACGGTPVHTQTFTVANTNVTLPLITVNTSAGIATVTGSIKDCNNDPVINGGIIMQKNGEYYRFPVGKNGNYQFTTLLCDHSAEVSLMAYDNAESVYSSSDDHTLTAGSNTRIDLKACGHSSDQFINYTINGTPYSFTYPASTFAPVTPGSKFTFAVFNELTREEAGFEFASNGGMEQKPLTYFVASQVNSSLTLSSPILVHITENGSTDQIFAGNFSGMFRGPAPAFTPYQISCRFRVKCRL